MKRGVVIACVGGLAVSAVAIGVYMQPAAPASDGVALVRPMARQARIQTGPARTARPARVETAAAAPTGALPPMYRLLLTRSIFSGGPVAASQQHSSSPTGILALRGIMQQGRGFIAFVENTSSREAQQVRVGDSVGPGKIVDIDLHAVKYATGGRSLRVGVGQTFDGGSSNAASADPATNALAAVHQGPE